jgi:predicted DNA-binding protein
MAMVVQFPPELQERLDQLANETGRPPQEFVLDAMAGYFDELADLRQTLDGRYDEVVSGEVEGISGEDVAAYFQRKSADRRAQRSERISVSS